MGNTHLAVRRAKQPGRIAQRRNLVFSEFTQRDLNRYQTSIRKQATTGQTGEVTVETQLNQKISVIYM
jgi:hypothetical protein